MPREFITKKGFEKLREELSDLRNKKRPEVAEKLRVALSFGDISENPEYAEAKDEQAFVEGRIAEIESILRDAMIVQSSSAGPSQVAAIGCAVELISRKQKRNFLLVGKGEGDPLRDEISSDSPLGRAVLGKKIGVVVKVSTPSGTRQYKIVKIA